MRKKTYERVVLFAALICASISLMLHMQRPEPKVHNDVNFMAIVEDVIDDTSHNVVQIADDTYQKLEDRRIAEEEAAKAEEAARIAAEEEAARKATEEAAAEQESQNYSQSNGSGLTQSSGVNWHNGRKEMWYSSQVLYHHRTPEWWVDAEGFYRTQEGYYVVAASDMAQGTIFQGSKGMCQVLDSGCPAGVTDYYVAW